MSRAIHVLNPNSSTEVTARIDAALAPFRRFGVPIHCHTLPEGPPGIEDQAQADEVVAPLLRQAAALEGDAAAFVIACFGDPGLHALRARTSLPVLGIQECAVLTAMTRGHRFGILAILPASIPRHLRSLGAMGVLPRVAGDRALNLGVAELGDRQRTLARMAEVGETLRDRDGAEVLILGCAGMASYRADLEQAIGLPVIEPCQAAVGMALARIALEEKDET